MSDMFTENPPIQLAPKRPDGSSSDESFAKERVAQITQNNKTAGSLAAQIKAAKEAATFPFELKRTVPGNPHFAVRVRRPSLMYLATSGRLPDKLQAIVAQMFEENADAEKIGKAVEDAAKNDIPLISAMIEGNAIEGFVEPRLVPRDQTPGDDALSVGDIDFEDLLDFFNWCNGGASEESDALAEFHPQGQAGPVGPVREGEGEQSATFRNPETGAG